VSDNNSDTGTSDEVNVTVTAAPTLSTVTLSSSSSSNPVAGSTVTLTATATPATGYTVASLVIEKKNTSTNEWEAVEDASYTASAPSLGSAVRRASTVDPSTGEVTVTYDFTAGAVGTDYEFRANATFSNGNTTATVLSTDAVASGGENQSLQLTSSLPTPTLSSYTLELIDHSGGTVFSSITVTNDDVTNNDGDPLPNQYRSPFVATYKYYQHTAAGKASAQLGEDANLTDWSDENNDGAVYVGYVTNDTKMGTDKVHAIWANDRYFHFVYRRSQSNNNRYVLDYQNYDIWNETVTGSGYSPTSGITISNFALLDNNYMWQLGDDPYRITFLNKATQFYANPTANSNASWGASSTGTYSILYWTSADGSSTDTSTDGPCRILYRGSSSYVAMTDDNNYNIRAIDTNHSKYTASSKIYIKQLPHLTINVLDRRDAVEAQLDAYYKSDATMQANVPYSLIRAYTSDHTLYYDATHNDAVTMSTAVLDDTKLTASSNNLYLKYTLDTDRWHPDTPTTGTYTSIVSAFEDGYDDDANWYAMRYNTTSGRFYSAATGSLPADIGVRNPNDEDLNYILGNTTTTGYDGTQGQWALIGTPYHLEIANRYHGFSSRIGIVEDATASTKPKIYASDATGVITTWEAVNYLSGQGNSFLFFRPQGGFNGQAPLLYLSNSSNVPQMSTTPGGGEKFDFYWAASTTEAVQPAARLTLTATATSVYVDGLTTLTATATPDTGKDVTYFAIEKETGDNEWTVVGTAYAGTNVTNATKDGDGVVTVTYEFTPTGAGTYNFRAKAIVDGDTESPILSTDDVADGGTGSALAITATVETITVKSDNYTLILVDKQGNELFTETNVSADRVSGTNSISGRNGDPLANDWRSPLVARYYYYANATDAQNNSGSNLFDWSSTDATPTVYVGYSINPDYDLDGSENRDVDGKTYLLKFAGGESFCQENADGFEDTAKAGIYPYINGEGGLFVYGEDKLNATKSGAASTRTRWVWYLEGGDPYRLKISSLQTNTDGQGADHYSYLRTYKPQGYGSVVTGAIPKNATIYDGNDGGDPTGSHNARHVPTEYMVLYGSTTSYMKLVTTEVVDDGDGDTSNDVRQTVTSFENHWKNNPTAANVIAANDNTFSVGTEPTDAQKTAALVTGKGWHTYNAWAYASTWTSSSKTFGYAEHWYKTVGVGTEVSGDFNGDFTLEEEEVEGALILLDQHGWEVMRKPITKTGNSKKAAYANAIKVYDSPMVSTYHFWTNFSKVSGYHKYVPTRNAAKASNNATHQGTGSSLADYPEKTSNGTLLDIYVTYEVKDEYRNSYTGAATESATDASQFLIRMGTQYAKDNSGTTVTGDTKENATAWKLHPNFNIDAEMDYRYSGTYSELTQNETEAAYLADTGEEAVHDKTYGRNGFDPYNLQIESAANAGKLFTTNATSAANDRTGGIVSTYADENVMTVTLATYNSNGTPMTDYWDIGTGYSIPKPSNQTFMAVQDANGNMRLMPRFDHAHVIEGFAMLAEPAAAQSTNDESHNQTTQLTTGTITYHIIDNSGAEVFDPLYYTGPGFNIEKIYQSPMVEEYYYHASQEDAALAANRETSTKTSFSVNDEVWISYKVKESFTTKPWVIYGSGNYMHAVIRNQVEGDNPGASTYLWWMRSQNKDCDNGGNTISTATLPFIDNSFAWEFATTGDPYNAKFLNKATSRYIRQEQDPSKNNGRMEELTVGQVAKDATPFCILYYDDETSGYCTMYNRSKSTYVLYNSGEWRQNATRTGDDRKLVFAETGTADMPAIDINVVDGSGNVECTLQGYYMKGGTWSNSFTPFYLRRYATSGHTFYYTLANAIANESAISGIVADNTVTTNGAVFVRYSLDSGWTTLTTGTETTNVMPSPTANNKIQWYAIKSSNTNQYWQASTDRTAAQLATTGTRPGNSDTDTDKRGQWGFKGTPYNLKLFDRYHGMNSYLGIPATSDSHAYVYAEETNHMTTWEVVTGMGNKSGLQIRPQGSLNGENTYAYVGYVNWGGITSGLSTSANNNVTNQLYWLLDTDDKKVGAIADVVIDGVSIGDALSAIFGHTNLERRYCEYTFYTGYTAVTDPLTNEETGASFEDQEPVTVTSDNLDETVYVQWDYTDDAPVFNEGVTNPRDYQYYMMGVGSGSYYTLMDVEESSGTYTFKPMDGVVTPRDQAHQFAIVGNPYSFYLYNRGADKNIRRKASLDLTFEDTEADGTTPTEVLEFDMPIVSTLTYSSTECSFRSKKSGRFLTVSNNAFTMAATSSPTQKTRFRYIIVPVRVFKEGATTWTSDAENDQKDYRMYGLEMNPNVSGTATARSTSERITTDYLRASGNAVGTARDYRHAFCDYTYYRSYDWTDELSEPIPTEGLSYYGGKEQNKKQFFATYTVDEQAFSRLYYMNANNNDAGVRERGEER